MGKLATFFIFCITSGIGQVLLSLGLGFVSYKGLDLALGFFKSYIIGSFSNLSTDLMQLVGLLGLGQGLSIIFGAYSALFATKQAMSFFGKKK